MTSLELLKLHQKILHFQCHLGMKKRYRSLVPGKFRRNQNLSAIKAI